MRKKAERCWKVSCLKKDPDGISCTTPLAYQAGELTFLSDRLSFLSTRVTFLSDKLTFLSTRLTFLQTRQPSGHAAGTKLWLLPARSLQMHHATSQYNRALYGVL